MKTIAFFDTKSYDKESFSPYISEEYNIRFFENKLNRDTVSMAACCDAVCAFVNDTIDKYVYCVEWDEFGTTYHRFTKKDYENLVAS